MNRFASLIAAVLLVAVASTAMGAIGWTGGIWPTNGNTYTSAQDIDVYVQVWKGGCTDADPLAACADIDARLYWRCTGDPTFNFIQMVYNVDQGNNDEFTGQIPAGHGCSEVEFYVEIEDLTDNEVLYPQDQNSNDPNFFLPITAVTAQDVLVTFQVCIPEGSAGGVCVTGSDAAITNWSQPGLAMSQPCPGVSPNLYVGNALFLAGTNPIVQYKYQKDDCNTWDGDPNHEFTIDDSGSTQTLAIDVWGWGVNDCPECGSPVEDASWGTVKALYR